MGFTSVENCIIKPHQRYMPKEDYPSHVLMCHHRSYLEALHQLQQEKNDLQIVSTWQHAREYRVLFKYRGTPIVLDNSRDNGEESMTHVIEHYFWSSEPLTVLNISSAGAISPDLSIGDPVIGLSAVRDNSSDRNLATTDVSAMSTPTVVNALRETSVSSGKTPHEGNIWSNGNMYYTWERLSELLAIPNLNPLAVETEMAAMCITAAWLNYNYAQRTSLKPSMSVGNLFYISDLLPQTHDDEWQDTMNNMALLYPYKVTSLLWAIRAISSLSGKD